MSNKKICVLLAERALGEVAQCLQSLNPGADCSLETSVVSTLPSLLATIELTLPEVILFDLSLGRPDPPDAVRRVHRAAPGIPLIVFADIADRDSAARCLADGAIGYLLKGYINAKTLERSLRTALERNTFEGLADLLRDELTGLYNRDGFMTLGMRAMERAARNQGTLVLLCARIENLRELRTKFGVAGSEQAVQDVASLLRSCFRRSDLLGRMGEAQFAALAVDAAEPSASILRQRVESRLAIQAQIGQPCNALSLKMSVEYWDDSDLRSFGEFLDAVELKLRQADATVMQADTL